MPLKPPPDHSRAIVLAVASVALCAFSYTITRSTLPFTGDNLHQLPHGGFYEDGTKTIKYGGPSQAPFGTSSTPFIIIASALLLPGIIYAIGTRRNTVTISCPACNTHHSA